MISRYKTEERDRFLSDCGIDLAIELVYLAAQGSVA